MRSPARRSSDDGKSITSLTPYVSQLMPEEPEEPEDDASVLTPEELELEDDQEDAVRKIGENRFVIRPNEDASDDADSGTPSPGPLADTQAQSASSPDSASPRQDADAREGATERSSASPASASPQQDAEAQSASSPASTSSREAADDGGAPNVDVESRALALEHAAGEYGIDAVVDAGDGVVERRLVADDQIAVFEEFLRWYARQIDPDASPAATISALLAEADLSE